VREKLCDNYSVRAARNELFDQSVLSSVPEEAMLPYPPSHDPDDLAGAKAKLRRVMRTTIGKELAALYEVPQDLSPELLALLMQLNQNVEE
jgi:hypothetical protein